MRPRLAIVASALCTTLAAGPAPACDCAYQDLRTEVFQSDAVFIGTVTAFEPIRAVTLNVDEKLKGSVTSPVTFRVGHSDCDYFLPPYEPEVGRKFLVFASLVDGVLSVTHCGRSGPLDERGSVLEKVRELLASPSGPSAALGRMDTTSASPARMDTTSASLARMGTTSASPTALRNPHRYDAGPNRSGCAMAGARCSNDRGR
jgi:hypothetical protein